MSEVRIAWTAGIKKYWGAKYFEGDIILYSREEDGKIINKLGKIVDIDAGSAQDGRFCIVEESSGHYYTVSENSVIDAIPSEERAKWLANWNDLEKKIGEKKLSATDMKYYKGESIIYEKQEAGKIIHKTGVVIGTFINEAHQGQKINRYYIVLNDESKQLAVHEDSVIGTINADNNNK